jgi:4-amino-4-deoxychorismate lyase
MILLNGLPQDCVPATDRGLQYGDGVFRTLSVSAARACWWEDHLAVLREDAARLGLVFDASLELSTEVNRVARHFPHGVIKVMLTRGCGPRGYAPPKSPQINRLVSGTARAIQCDSGHPLAVRTCDLRLACQPHLAGIKHLNRLENVLARIECDAVGVDEGLLYDTRGRLTGGVSHTVFVVLGARALTPRLACNGVNGVTRRRLLRAARRHGLVIEEGDLVREDLAGASEILLTNSVQGVCETRTLDGRSLAGGPWGARLREWLYEED